MINEYDALINILSDIEIKLTKPYLAEKSFKSILERFEKYKHNYKENATSNSITDKTPLISTPQEKINQLIRAIQHKITKYQNAFAATNLKAKLTSPYPFTVNRFFNQSKRINFTPSSYILHEILPRDIMYLIFSLFDIAQLNKLKTVSRKWKTLIESYTLEAKPFTIQLAGERLLIHPKNSDAPYKPIKLLNLEQSIILNLNENKEPIIEEIKNLRRKSSDILMNSCGKYYTIVIAFLSIITFLSITLVLQSNGFSVLSSVLLGLAATACLGLIATCASFLCYNSFNHVQNKLIENKANEYLSQLDIEKASEALKITEDQSTVIKEHKYILTSKISI